MDRVAWRTEESFLNLVYARFLPSNNYPSFPMNSTISLHPLAYLLSPFGEVVEGQGIRQGLGLFQGALGNYS